MKSSEAAMGGGEVGAQRPVLRSNELKKTGARRARVRTRDQNPLVPNSEHEDWRLKKDDFFIKAEKNEYICTSKEGMKKNKFICS